MGQDGKPIAGLDPVSSFPYYKIQVWKTSVGAWQDVQMRFDSLDDLHCFAIEQLAWTEKTRIVAVKGPGRRRIDGLFDAFGEPL